MCSYNAHVCVVMWYDVTAMHMTCLYWWVIKKQYPSFCSTSEVTFERVSAAFRITFAASAAICMIFLYYLVKVRQCAFLCNTVKLCYCNAHDLLYWWLNEKECPSYTFLYCYVRLYVVFFFTTASKCSNAHDYVVLFVKAVAIRMTMLYYWYSCMYPSAWLCYTT